MEGYGRSARILAIGSAAFALMLFPIRTHGQSADSGSQQSAVPSSRDDVKALGELVRELQAQVQGLNLRVQTLEKNEMAATAESASLRAQLAMARARVAVPGGASETGGGRTQTAGNANDVSSTNASSAWPADTGQSSDERLSLLEENLELANAKIKEQSQTKIESSSKYRVRLSGLALFFDLCVGKLEIFFKQRETFVRTLPRVSRPR